MNNRAGFLEKLESEVENCRRCSLYKTRTNIVFGAGPANAELMIVSEAPGFNEDQKGVPFVGAAGELLNKLLKMTGLKREESYICNILKCRPVTSNLENRPPRSEEIEACTPFLDRQIEIVKPNLIVTLGRYSASYILPKIGYSFRSMAGVHGKTFRGCLLNKAVTVIPTYHPAAALYNPKYKDAIEEDFRVIGRELEKLFNTSRLRCGLSDRLWQVQEKKDMKLPRSIRSRQPIL